MPELFQWIDPEQGVRLALMPRPPGGQRLDFALKALHQAGVDILVSLQPESEAVHCGLEREGEAAETVGMEFIRHAITDHGVPDDPEAAVALARELAGRIRAGNGVLMHCFAGIGRAGLMSILTMGALGYKLTEAAAKASAARFIPVPETSTQFLWLEETFQNHFDAESD